MKKYLLILSFQFVLLISVAQTFEWLATESLDYEYNPEMIQFATTSDDLDNAYLFGIKEHVDFYNRSYGVVFLNKYDASGQVAWSKEIDGLSAASGMVTNSTGDVFLIGTFRADLNFWDEGSLSYSGDAEQGYFAKLQADGSFSWAMDLSELYDGSSLPSDIIVDVEGNIFLSHMGGADGYISKFDDDGNLLMDIHQYQAGLISGIDVDLDGNVLVGGSCSAASAMFGGVNYVTPFSYSMYIAKYDDSGTPLWVEFIEDVTCVFPAVRVTEDGFVYMSGPLAFTTMFGTHVAEGPSWVYDFFIARLSPEGEFEWIMEVPEVVSGDAGPGPLNHIAVNGNGNVVFGGVCRGNVDWGNGMESNANLYYDVFLTEINSEGEMEWVKTAGGDYFDKVHSISVSSMGNVFLSGTTGNEATFDTIAFQSDLYNNPFLAKLDMGLTTGITQERKTNSDLKVFPNPASSDKVTVYFEGDVQSQKSELNVFSSTGKQVYQVQLSPTHTDHQIETADWPAGIYLITTRSDGKLVARTKFVVR